MQPKLKQAPGVSKYSLHLQPSLTLLLNAFEYAQELRCPAWDFAVEIEDLRAIGLTNSDLRWLVCKGLVEHAVETQASGRKRSFRAAGQLRLCENTCVVLTAAGAMFARSLCPGRLNGSPPREKLVVRPGEKVVVRPGVPYWDGNLRELRLGPRLVKKFRQPAPNQEMILASFEEEGWPARIDDPLPPQAGEGAKRRPHATTQNLNRQPKGGRSA